MKNTNRNISIVAANLMPDGSFDIYLDFSGQREYLMHHRNRPCLYSALSGGVRLDDWNRSKLWKPRCHVWNGRTRVRQEKSVFSHLDRVIRDFLACRSEDAVFGAYREAAVLADSAA